MNDKRWKYMSKEEKAKYQKELDVLNAYYKGRVGTPKYDSEYLERVRDTDPMTASEKKALNKIIEEVNKKIKTSRIKNMSGKAERELIHKLAKEHGIMTYECLKMVIQR